MRIQRLVGVGGALVDVLAVVPSLPERGGDVLASEGLVSTGGGYNVLAAASRQGLAAAYLGLHGTGRFGDQVREDLARDRIAALLPPTTTGDTGFCIGLVDAEGERTYVTRYGVEGRMTASDLLAARDGDAVSVSGYELAYEHGPLVAAWFAALPDTVVTIFDPGPLVAALDPDLLAMVLERVDWVSLNAREAASLTGADGAEPAARAWAAARPRPRAGLVVRDGAVGCVLATDDDTVRIPSIAPQSTPLDTSGAGDTHVGAFVAALARGEAPADAAAIAGAAAAIAVGRRGAATAPTLAETRALLAAVRAERASG